MISFTEHGAAGQRVKVQVNRSGVSRYLVTFCILIPNDLEIKVPR